MAYLACLKRQIERYLIILGVLNITRYIGTYVFDFYDVSRYSHIFIISASISYVFLVPYAIHKGWIDDVNFF